MIGRSLPAIVLAGVALISVAPTHAEQLYIGYWSQHTPKGASFKCEGVRTNDRLIEVLSKAGWATDQSIPRIDWNTQEAVVVSPDKFYDNADIAFFGINRKPGGFKLEYGWVSWKDGGVTCASGNICSVSQGSHEAPSPETIVISYQRDMDKGQSFSCSNLGIDP